MKPILKLVDKLGEARRVEILRKVDIGDFLTGEDYITPEEYDPEKCSMVTCSTMLKIKPELIRHLIEKLKVETFPGKTDETYRKRYALGNLTHEWFPSYTSTFCALNSKDVFYKGLRKSGPSRESRWQQAWGSTTLEWRIHREAFIQQQFDVVDEQIADLVKHCNAMFDEELLDFVRNINVDKEWLELKRDDLVGLLVIELSKVEAEIVELKEKRSKLDIQIAQSDRENVVKYLLEDEELGLSDESKERVKILAAESAYKIPPSRSRRFS